MRELFALILLSGIIILSALNIYAIVSLTENTAEKIMTASVYYSTGDINSALVSASEGKSIWESKRLFEHCVIRQDRIDKISELMDRIIHEIENREPDASLTADLLIGELNNIRDSEIISLGSIF